MRKTLITSFALALTANPALAAETLHETLTAPGACSVVEVRGDLKKTSEGITYRVHDFANAASKTVFVSSMMDVDDTKPYAPFSAQSQDEQARIGELKALTSLCRSRGKTVIRVDERYCELTYSFNDGEEYRRKVFDYARGETSGLGYKTKREADMSDIGKTELAKYRRFLPEKCHKPLF